MMIFRESFNAWLEKALSEKIPSEVDAFCFNLNYPEGYENIIYGLQLVGDSRYDETDPGWASHDLWAPKKRDLLIPNDFSTDDWGVCLSKVKALLEAYLISDKPSGRFSQAAPSGGNRVC